MKSLTCLVAGGVFITILVATAEAAPVNFQLSGSLQGTLNGSGYQDQGTGELVEVPIDGAIWANLDYIFTLNDEESYHVDIDSRIQTSYNGSSPYDLSNSYVEAFFTPNSNVIDFLSQPEHSVALTPFYSLAVPGEYVHQGFGFWDIQLTLNGITHTIDSLGENISFFVDGHHVVIAPTRSNYGVGYLDAMGGFIISHHGNPDPEPSPEPGTLLLFATGMAGLAGSRLRKKT